MQNAVKRNLIGLCTYVIGRIDSFFEFTLLEMAELHIFEFPFAYICRMAPAYCVSSIYNRILLTLCSKKQYITNLTAQRISAASDAQLYIACSFRSLTLSFPHFSDYGKNESAKAFRAILV